MWPLARLMEFIGVGLAATGCLFLFLGLVAPSQVSSERGDGPARRSRAARDARPVSLRYDRLLLLVGVPILVAGILIEFL